MRRLMVAAALAVLCGTVAACSDSDDSANPGTSAATAATTATASAAATNAATGSGNTQQICAEARQVVTNAITKFSQEVGKLTTSSEASAAVRSVKALFTEWADGLRDLAAKATDAQVKAALNETADRIAEVAASLKSMADLEKADKLLDSPEVEAAQAKFDSLCG